MAWHPADELLPTAWVLPGPGSRELFAEIRWLQVTLDGETVWRFRAVTWAQPRELIGYFVDLKQAAAAAHRIGLATLTPKSDFGLYKNRPTAQEAQLAGQPGVAG